MAKPSNVRFVTGAHYLEVENGLLFTLGTILKSHLRSDRRKTSPVHQDLADLADYMTRYTNNPKDQVLFVMVKGARAGTKSTQSERDQRRER